jgi:hypothetical protein
MGRYRSTADLPPGRTPQPTIDTVGARTGSLLVLVAVTEKERIAPTLAAAEAYTKSRLGPI